MDLQMRDHAAAQSPKFDHKQLWFQVHIKMVAWTPLNIGSRASHVNLVPPTNGWTDGMCQWEWILGKSFMQLFNMTRRIGWTTSTWQNVWSMHHLSWMEGIYPPWWRESAQMTSCWGESDYLQNLADVHDAIIEACVFQMSHTRKVHSYIYSQRTSVFWRNKLEKSVLNL